MRAHFVRIANGLAHESYAVSREPPHVNLESQTAPQPSDAEVVRRIREVGAIALGKTNVSQLLLFVGAQNPLLASDEGQVQTSVSDGAVSRRASWVPLPLDGRHLTSSTA